MKDKSFQIWLDIQMIDKLLLIPTRQNKPIWELDEEKWNPDLI